MVSRSYAEAVTKGSSCCGAPTKQKGVASQLAGYRQADLAGLPEDAVTNSFGCGDPVALSGIKAGDVVLDLGSGAGIDLLLAAEKVGPTGRVIGVDMTDEMIDRARQNIARSPHRNIEVRKGIIEELPVEMGSVDWVISNCVINLSPNKPRVFAEIARVLKPGGRFAISDIVAQDLPDWAKQAAAMYSACISGAISEADYVRGLEAAGLSQVEVVGRLVYEPEQVISMVEAEISAAAGKLLRQHAATLTGKIWSAKVRGQKA
jgi:ubiquinone/menaquinone biosynthesis C-methylase UbiE